MEESGSPEGRVELGSREVGKKTRAGFIEAGSRNCQGLKCFQGNGTHCLYQGLFSKKEELSGQLGIFGLLCQEPGM